MTNDVLEQQFRIANKLAREIWTSISGIFAPIEPYQVGKKVWIDIHMRDGVITCSIPSDCTMEISCIKNEESNLGTGSDVVVETVQAAKKYILAVAENLKKQVA